MKDNMVCRCLKELECPSLALTESETVAGEWGVELHALIRLSGSPPYLFAGDKDVRDDSLWMQALLLAEAAAPALDKRGDCASSRILAHESWITAARRADSLPIAYGAIMP